MIRDIINLLAKYIDSRYYSLLDKKARDFYFKKYGVFIRRAKFRNGSDLLFRYPISVIDGLSFLNRYFEEDKVRVCGNIKYIGCDLYYSDYIKNFKYMTNLESFRHKIYTYLVGTESIFDDLIEFSKTKNVSKMGTIVEIRTDKNLDPAVLRDRVGRLTLSGYKISTSEFNMQRVPDDIISHANRIYDKKNTHTYSELISIEDPHVSENLNIIAPKLTTINSVLLSTTVALIKKYPSIQNVRPLFAIDEVDDKWFEDYLFLRNFDFNLKYMNGVIFPGKDVQKLIETERKVIRLTKAEGKKRYYRTLEALLDFAPTDEDWECFDFGKCMTIRDL